MRHAFSWWVLSSLLFSATSFAVPPFGYGKRLIQVGEREAYWLDPQQMERLSDINHSIGRCGGFMDITETFQRERILPPPRLSSVKLGIRTLHQMRGAQIVLPELKAENIQAVTQTLSHFPSRHYRSDSGVQSSQWIYDQFKLLSAGRQDVTVTSYSHTWPQPSVIAMIKGSRDLAGEAVIIGAHQDSISLVGSAPGADDDASGVATVIEIFRALMKTGFKPERSVYFMAYAGEEAGLLGSQVIAQEFKAKQIAIAGVMQFDMTTYPGNSDRTLTFITDFVNPELTEFSKKLVDAYVKVPWTTGRCGYGCSDHASWTRNGFPSVFPFEATFANSNKRIHSSKDTISDAKLDFDFGLNFAKLGAAFILELSTEKRF